MDNNIIVVLGQTGSGKSTIATLLAKRFGYDRILEYTTRPIRDGEVNNVEYHFISNEEFLRLIDENALISYTYFDTIYGRWYYGSIKKDYQKNGIIVSNPSALKMLKENGVKVKSVYIQIDDKTIISRLSSRGDDVREVQRRLDKDRAKFEELPQYVDIIVDGNLTPEQIVNEIVSKLLNKED